MPNRKVRSPGNGERRQSRMLPIAVIGAAAILLVALGGSAVAKSLIRAGDIATGAVNSRAVKNGAIMPRDLNAKAKRTLTGATGAPGANGVNGANGPNGANGANGGDGTDGADGDGGADGTDGTDGTDGIDGILGPLSSSAGLVALPTATPPTVVVALTVPAANYVVLAKTQLFHSGAGDTVDCTLKAGTTTIDQISIKTLPALASIPVSLQAVTSTSPTQLSVECDVSVADGTANFSRLIAIPVN